MYKLPAAILVLTAAALTLWWMSTGRYNGTERYLFGRVEAAASGEAPSPANIIREFALPSECATKSCFFRGSRLANATYARGNLRPTDDGLVFELDGFAGECISTEMAAKRFGGDIGQRCVDGQCWYLEAKRDWGIVAFGLSKPDSSCVSSVVINSLELARRRAVRPAS